jgi:hypothetical protein
MDGRCRTGMAGARVVLSVDVHVDSRLALTIERHFFNFHPDS